MRRVRLEKLWLTKNAQADRASSRTAPARLGSARGASSPGRSASAAFARMSEVRSSTSFNPDRLIGCLGAYRIPLIPAQAGIQAPSGRVALGPRLRGNERNAVGSKAPDQPIWIE